MGLIKRHLGNELFKSSLILLILANIGNILNFLFQFFMARMLSADDFGTLSFLSNLLFIFGVPALAIQMILSKKTVALNLNKENGKIKGLLLSSNRKLFVISLYLMGVYLVLAYLARTFVKIDYPILAVFSLMIFISLVYPALLGILQGMKKFDSLGKINVLTFSIKFVFGVSLVYFGFQIWGALIGIILGTYLAFIIGYLPFRKIKEEKEDVNLDFSKNYFEIIALLMITLSYSLDVLIAKFIFDPTTVGNYAKISLLGKMILFAGMTISTVMFPITSERKLKGEESKGVLKKALLFNSAVIFLALLLLYFFANPIISLVFGKEYIYLTQMLLPVAISFSLLALTVLFILYNVSIDNFSNNNSRIFSLAIILQIGFLVLADTLEAFISTFLYSTIILFILSIITNLKWKKLV